MKIIKSVIPAVSVLIAAGVLLPSTSSAAALNHAADAPTYRSSVGDLREGSAIDLAKIKLVVRPSTVAVLVRTYEPVPASRLRCIDEIRIELGDSAYVVIRTLNGKVVAGTHDAGRVPRPWPVTRPDSRSFHVMFPRSQVTSYKANGKWSAYSTSGAGCTPNLNEMVDQVPDAGYVVP